MSYDNDQFTRVAGWGGKVEQMVKDANEAGLDIHTVTLRLNNGGIDLTIESTDADLEDVTWLESSA